MATSCKDEAINSYEESVDSGFDEISKFDQDISKNGPVPFGYVFAKMPNSKFWHRYYLRYQKPFL